VSATGRSVVARGLAEFTWAAVRSHRRDVRFWLIQMLVIGIAMSHFLLEIAAERESLGAFGHGLLHLPAPAFAIPVVLAALWYGVEGGVLTGLGVTIIGLPNLVLFHRTNFDWLGEASVYATVLAVALLVAVLAEREAESRLRSEAMDRRLATIHNITGVLSDHDETHRLVRAVLGGLEGDGGFCAVGFAPTTGFMAGPIVMGEDGTRARIESAVLALDFLTGTIPPGVLAEPVGNGQASFGTLLVDCTPNVGGPQDETMLTLVAKELGVAIENILMQNLERANLQRYARAMTVAQEAERRRIARDLHDETAQAVVVLARGLGRLIEQNDGPAAETATDLREVATRTLSSLRSTIWALRPTLLDDLGLHPAIEWLAEHQAARGGCSVDIVVIGTPLRLDPDVELAAFRIAQEALTNVDRHSGQEQATVTLEFTADELKLLIEDEGSGFDPRVPGSTGLGLTGMRERAEIVDGSLELVSSPGGGTTIMLAVPIVDSARIDTSEPAEQHMSNGIAQQTPSARRDPPRDRD